MYIQAIPTTVLTAFSLFTLIVAVAFGFMLRLEYTTLRARGKGLAWWVIRLAAIPILALCAALVLLPAHATRRMEGLAIFYLLLLTLAPLLWFGLHWLVGKVTRPRLSGMESFVLALNIPAFAIIAALLGHQVQSLAFSLHHQLNREQAAPSVEMSQANKALHTRLHTRRYTTTGGDFFVSRWHSPEPLAVERVDWMQESHEIMEVNRLRPMNICRDGTDLVMLEAADRKPGHLRVYWRTAGSPLYRSDLPSRDDSVTAQPLVPDWTDDGVSLPETFPRTSLIVGRLLAHGKADYARNAPGPNTGSDFDCLPAKIETPAGLYLTISRPNGELMTALLERPTADPVISRPAIPSD